VFIEFGEKLDETQKESLMIDTYDAVKRIEKKLDDIMISLARIERQTRDI
jgi:hypothetical protein